jgi:hypothetical protein
MGMRSKNARAHDAIESAYLADVKRCACVVCNVPAPSSGHHPLQGLHLIAIALCWDCHQGPHGWHGDKSRWRAAKMTELKAINETRRRVEQLRSGVTHRPGPPNARPKPKPLPKSAVSNLSSSKILPRAA